MNRKARVTEHSQRHSRGILWRCSVTFDVKHGKVPRADKLYRAIVGCPSHDESRELSGERALAENEDGVFHHARGLVVAAHVPPDWRYSRFRQKSALDPRCHGKIALQGALFGARKMVQAEPH